MLDNGLSANPSVTGYRLPRGVDILHDPFLNKGSAFTERERMSLGLHGLLPPRVMTVEQQMTRVLENFEKKPTDLEKYIFMTSLQDRNETLFYHVVMANIEKMMPIIYTPTVGKGCQEYGHIFRRARGMFVTKHDRGKVREVLRNWPMSDVRVIVVTDGERILGLGDLGASGMGIPIGKLSLYSACAGIHPMYTLPITLDVGTNNESLLKDPLYLGIPQKRIGGDEYDSFLEEFLTACKDVFPKALVQFEDFGNHNAFRLLAKYRERICTFNDDIQGTGGVALAGLYSALRITKRPLAEQKILFLGAGEAAVGIGDLIVSAMEDEGAAKKEARERCWFFDSKALVESNRTDLAEHKRPYAHRHAPVRSFIEAVKALKPTTIIGVSGQPRTFTREIVEAMAKINDRPIVFALSNPTSKAECTAQEAYSWSSGRAVYASGSPFDPVTLEGKTFVPGQANNAYVFPGAGLGIIASGARTVPDEMFFESAKVLAAMVSDEDLAAGRIFPPLTRIRDISAHIAAACAKVAFDKGLTDRKRPDDLTEFMRSVQFQPVYREYV